MEQSKQQAKRIFAGNDFVLDPVATGMLRNKMREIKIIIQVNAQKARSAEKHSIFFFSLQPFHKTT